MVLKAKSLAGHLSKAHGYRNPIKRKICGTVCFPCMMDFQTRFKLVHHVCYCSELCRNEWAQMPDVPFEEFCALVEKNRVDSKLLADSGKNPFTSVVKTCRVPGPIQFPQLARGRGRPKKG